VLLEAPLHLRDDLLAVSGDEDDDVVSEQIPSGEGVIEDGDLGSAVRELLRVKPEDHRGRECSAAPSGSRRVPAHRPSAASDPSAETPEQLLLVPEDVGAPLSVGSTALVLILSVGR
jgi:hypothetical protein